MFIWPHSHILALLQVCLNIILQHLTGSFSLFFILLATHGIYFEHVSSLSLQYELVSVPCFLYSQTVSIPLPIVCTGSQLGKGNLHATILVSSFTSWANFISSFSICYYKKHIFQGEKQKKTHLLEGKTYLLGKNKINPHLLGGKTYLLGGKKTTHLLEKNKKKHIFQGKNKLRFNCLYIPFFVEIKHKDPIIGQNHSLQVLSRPVLFVYTCMKNPTPACIV